VDRRSAAVTAGLIIEGRPTERIIVPERRLADVQEPFRKRDEDTGQCRKLRQV
jgi:hypothetical protein